MLRSSRQAPALTYVAVCIALLALSAITARREDANDQVTLDALTPIMMTASNVGAALVPRVRQLATLAAVLVTLFSLVALSPSNAGRVIAASLPAIFSDRAYPKRAATLFPALFIIGASAEARYIDVLRMAPRGVRDTLTAFCSIAVVAWFCATSSLWFSGNRIAYGKPGEERLVEQLAPQLTPGTIVIGEMHDSYNRGRFSYLLHDILTAAERQPLFWLRSTQ